MYFTQAIYRLHIMFRHMPVPRDTSVSRQIIIVCCESVGNCQTLSKDGPSQLVNSINFVLFMFFASDVHCFWPILSRSDVCPPHGLHIVFMFINRQLFISRDIQWHVTVFSFFFVKVKVEFQILWGREAPEMKYWLYDRIEVRYNNALTSNSSIKSAFKSRKNTPLYRLVL